MEIYVKNQIKALRREGYGYGKIAELLNISVKTLQRWYREEILVAKRTLTNRRYYTCDQYLEYRG